METASTIPAQYAIAEGGELFPACLKHLRRLYPEVYGPAVFLGWAPVNRDLHLGEDKSRLSRGNLINNTLSYLGVYAGRFKNMISSKARMNKTIPNSTNAYLDNPPVVSTPDPLEYAPPPGRFV